MEAFNDIFEDCTSLGTKIPKEDYLTEGKHIVIDQGQKTIAGYTGLEEGLYEDVPAIIFGDHTRIIKYVDEPFFLGADGVKLLKSKRKDANYKYLYYALKNARIPDTGYNRHFKWLKEISIEYPDCGKQQDIVNVLDKISLIIKKRNLELELLDELIKARFVELFGDPICNSRGLPLTKGDSFFKLSNGKFVPEAKRFEEGIPVYGGNGISWYTDEALLQEDTIVVGRVGFQSGNVHYAEGPLMISDNAMYISWYDSEKYDLLFLCHLMEHIDFKRLQDAGDLKKITQKPFMSMEYIQPSLEQQYIYKSFVKQVDKSKVVVQKSLEKVQVLFDSLMQNYFG